jgi:alcohol dehydrogenase class IV
MNKFQIKTEIYYGPDSLSYLNRYGDEAVLIVTDAFMASTDLLRQVVAALNGARVTVFDQVVPNPSVDVIADAYHVFGQVEPKAVIALGGGSSIDTAKAVNKIAIESGVTDFAFIAIPTTSGSGSEMTSYAIITSGTTKMALMSPDMYPDVAILDPEAVRTTPQSLTADAGMDAVSHAVEAYVSQHHTDFADAMAEKALHLLMDYLPATYIDGADMAARERVHNAACLAGMAFENAGLGIVHSLSHAIGGSFHVPHGRLNAMIMPCVMEFNAGNLRLTKEAPTPVAIRYAQLGHSLGMAAATIRGQALGLISLIKHLRRDLEMPERITEAGVGLGEFLGAIPDLARTALVDPCTGANPRPVTTEDLEGLLRTLL